MGTKAIGKAENAHAFCLSCDLCHLDEDMAPPAAYFDCLQDRVHVDVGRGRAVRVAMASRVSAVDMPAREESLVAVFGRELSVY